MPRIKVLEMSDLSFDELGSNGLDSEDAVIFVVLPNKLQRLKDVAYCEVEDDFLDYEIIDEIVNASYSAEDYY